MKRKLETNTYLYKFESWERVLTYLENIDLSRLYQVRIRKSSKSNKWLITERSS